jgi:Zn-dependent protease with chaperone function
VSPDAYDRLVARLERRAADWPRLYRAQVVVLAALGYTYIVLMLVVVLAVAVGCAALLIWHPSVVTIKLGLVVGVASGAIWWQAVRALWVRIAAPEGLSLSREDYPRLHEAIDDARHQIGAAPVHAVVLDGNLNAAMAQTPRLGVLGWYRNTLVLGLPLLRTLSVDQARSVIAHELGHLSGEHGRISAWIYRVRATWARLLAGLQAGGRGGIVVGPFMRWYAPYFNACTFALARSHERQADAVAVQVAGCDEAARALLRVAVVGRHAGERFWPTFQRLAGDAEAPPAGYLLPLQRALAELPASDGRRWLSEAWLASTDRVDTHPCLRERVEAMGYARAKRVLDEGPPAAPPPSASEAWLGVREGGLAAALDQAWARSVAAPWAEHHREVLDHRKRQRELAATRASATLTEAQSWELARLTAALDGASAAGPLLEEVTTRWPKNAAALYMLGCHRLDLDDESGLALLQRAAEADRNATAAVQDRLRLFHDRHGRREQAMQADRELYDRQELERKAHEERRKLPKKGQLRPHGLDDAGLAPARAVLARYPEITRADLARVEVKFLPENPYFVIALRIRTAWWKPRASDADQKLLVKLVGELQLPGAFYAITAGGNTAAMAKAVRKRGALIYERPR